MRQFFAVLAAAVTAALIPALVISAVTLAWGGRAALSVLSLTFVVALAVSLIHVLLFGLVASGWLLRIGRFRLTSMALLGSVIGVVPAAIWQFPLKHGAGTNFWSEGVQKIEDGVPTWAGWVDYFELIAWAGSLGALGAAAFYFVYKGMSPNYSFKPMPLRGTA